MKGTRPHTPGASTSEPILHPQLNRLLHGTMAPTIGAMVYELAAGLRAGKDILQSYGVTVPQFQQLAGIPEFKAMLQAAKREFSSLPNTADRVRLKAQVMTELALEEMWEVIRHPSQPAAARVSAFNAVKGLTGLDRPEEAQPMQKFSLKIVLPGTDINGSVQNGARTITLEGTHTADPDLASAQVGRSAPIPGMGAELGAKSDQLVRLEEKAA